MEELIDRIFGFLPQRRVFWSGVGSLLLIFALQYINKWLHEIMMLPWMKEENQQKRKQLMQSTKQNNKNQSTDWQG
jgi:hypothetical protein